MFPTKKPFDMAESYWKLRGTTKKQHKVTTPVMFIE